MRHAGGVKGLGAEVWKCVIAVETEVWSWKSEEEIGRTFLCAASPLEMSASENGRNIL